MQIKFIHKVPKAKRVRPTRRREEPPAAMPKNDSPAENAAGQKPAAVAVPVHPVSDPQPEEDSPKKKTKRQSKKRRGEGRPAITITEQNK